MPAFWLTINPSNLQNPLILILAGALYSTDMATSAIYKIIATSNPVAVAQFFHTTCKAILDGLLGSKPGETRILSDISNYFRVVESNGHGMLHLHALVWAQGNLDFVHLHDRILTDGLFATHMIQYLESVVRHSIHCIDPDDPEMSISRTTPSANGPKSDTEFLQKLSQDVNHVASLKQLHSKHHSATCFKYHHQNSGKATCHFGMPHNLLKTSKVDDHGVIHLARNHPWVNPWNPAIASCIRSNHNISWIPTVSKSLSLVYYITNYATKDDISPLQMVTKAALLKQAINQANTTQSPTTTQMRLRQRGMDNFTLCCFNSLSQDRKVSRVQVASTLLQFPSYYTLNYNFSHLNLWWLRRYICAIIQPDHAQQSSPSNAVAEEPCSYDYSASAPASIFDNYKWRGATLTSLSIFEYCMLVRTKRLQDATTDDIPFAEKHPRHRTHLQQLAQSPHQTATVTLQGQLSEFQSSEDTILGGHPTTTVIQNDLTEVLLGLFIP
jgi:hypothetical protein